MFVSTGQAWQFVDFMDCAGVCTITSASISRMDENYNILPHGVNFQDAIFPDTADVHRMFSSLFQFSNCTSGTNVHQYTPDWEAQEDSRVCIHSCFANRKGVLRISTSKDNNFLEISSTYLIPQINTCANLLDYSMIIYFLLNPDTYI